jgi:hypothetical protein
MKINDFVKRVKIIKIDISVYINLDNEKIIMLNFLISG